MSEQPVNRWRLVLCAPGPEPRKALRLHPCISYYHTIVTLRQVLGSRYVAHTRYVVPLSHTAGSKEWLAAEAVRTQMNCPLMVSWVWQLERGRAGDCPLDLFLVPRPAGMCWKCDGAVEGRAILCPECKRKRHTAYNSWWQRHQRQLQRYLRQKNNAAAPQ